MNRESFRRRLLRALILCCCRSEFSAERFWRERFLTTTIRLFKELSSNRQSVPAARAVRAAEAVRQATAEEAVLAAAEAHAAAAAAAAAGAINN